MSGKRKLLLIVFVVASVASMWARYAYEKQKREKMERLLDSLARSEREQTLGRGFATDATPTPAPTVEETRDIFDSDLPREKLEAFRQAVGKEFRLMELRFGNELTTAVVSTDGTTAQQFMIARDEKQARGPNAVNLIGDNALADSLYDPKLIKLDLIPKLAKDAVARAGLAGGRVTSVSLAYAGIRYKGETPEWTVAVERGTAPPDWDHKFVTYDAAGKFKSLF